MPLAAILLGAMLCDLAFRGTEHEFAHQLGQDFGNSGTFWRWAGAMGIVGTLGYIPAIRPVSNALLGLVLVALTLANKGLFAQAQQLITNPPAAAPGVPLSSYGSSSSSSSSSSSGGSSILDNLGFGIQTSSLLGGGSGGGSTLGTLGTVAEFAALA